MKPNDPIHLGLEYDNYGNPMKQRASLTKREWLVGMIISSGMNPFTLGNEHLAKNAIELADEIIDQLNEDEKNE